MHIYTPVSPGWQRVGGCLLLLGSFGTESGLQRDMLHLGLNRVRWGSLRASRNIDANFTCPFACEWQLFAACVACTAARFKVNPYKHLNHNRQLLRQGATAILLPKISQRDPEMKWDQEMMCRSFLRADTSVWTFSFGHHAHVDFAP